MGEKTVVGWRVSILCNGRRVPGLDDESAVFFSKSRTGALTFAGGYSDAQEPRLVKVTKRKAVSCEGIVEHAVDFKGDRVADIVVLPKDNQFGHHNRVRVTRITSVRP